MKSYLLIGMLALASVASAQNTQERKMIVSFKNGTTTEYNVGNIDNLTFVEIEVEGQDESMVAKIGEVLPNWSNGYLDIHMINSGRGECNFFVLPDGTTLLVDAGEYDESVKNLVDRKPDASTRPYMVDAKYIKHFMPSSSTTIDWCVPSLLTAEHIGSSGYTDKSTNGYILSGLTALYQEVQFKKVVDMGYPNYSKDTSIPAMTGDLAANWETFVNWGVGRNLFTAERFNVGTEQIKLLNNKDEYSNFRIFNIVGNGYAYDAKGDSIVYKSVAKGNPASLGFHMTYGKFDWISCGDLSSSAQNFVATYMSDGISTVNGVDVFKAHGHLATGTWGSGMQKALFSPRVIVAHTLTSSHPDTKILNSIFTGEFDNASYTWDKDVFFTNVHSTLKTSNADLINQVSDYDGHIVIRVLPGGSAYYVYLLEDTNFDYKVKSIFGPYESK